LLRRATEGLAQIWKKCWSQSIGIDDFFALGGHSLLAVRHFALVEEAFGRKVPLATLFEAATIEQLAAVLRKEVRRDASSPLVPIQPGGSLPPLFCVHGHSGEVLFYRPLSQWLGSEQPFYALQAQTQDGQPVYGTVEEMAEHYIREMRDVRPRGPTILPVIVSARWWHTKWLSG
jgi:acyl carrier protein